MVARSTLSNCGTWANNARMIVVAVVPEKDTFTAAKFEAFFGIILAVFVGMRSVDEEKSGMACLAKIPLSSVGKMLRNLFLAWLTLEITTNNSAVDEMEIIFR